MSSYSDEAMAKLRLVVDVIVRSLSTPAFHAAWTELVVLQRVEA